MFYQRVNYDSTFYNRKTGKLYFNVKNISKYKKIYVN